MRRLAIAVLTAALALPAQAADYTSYTHQAVGFSIDIPAGFQATSDTVAGSDNGVVYDSGDQQLQIWGGTAELGTYDSEMSQRESFITGDGWTEEESYKEADYAGFTVNSDQGGRTLTSYAVPLCDGQKFAAFQLEYATDDEDAWQEVADHILDSIEETDDAC